MRAEGLATYAKKNGLAVTLYQDYGWPAKKLETALLKCMADKQMFYIILKSADVLITVSGDDTYMTVYNPTEDALELLGSLAGSEGFFMWKR